MRCSRNWYRAHDFIEQLRHWVSNVIREHASRADMRNLCEEGESGRKRWHYTCDDAGRRTKDRRTG